MTGGTAKVENKPVDFARKDAAVTVTADDRGEDYKFDHWELSEDSAKIDLNNEQLKNATLNFPMPDGPVKLTAVYSAAVTVVNGIAEAGTESGETIFVQSLNMIPVKDIFGKSSQKNDIAAKPILS